MKIITILLIAFFTMIDADATQSIFLGTVQFPSKIDNPSPLPLLFKGSEYTLMLDKDSKIPKRGFFEIYDERSCCEFYFLITERIKLPESADFKFLETVSEYRLFKLTRDSKTKEVITNALALEENQSIKVEQIEYWIIEEIASKDEQGTLIQRTIPENCIIILTKPTFISRVESEEWKNDDIYIKLPKLIFDDMVDEKTWQEVCSKMLFAAIDLRCLHKKMTKTIKSCAQNCILSVPDPLNCYISTHARV